MLSSKSEKSVDPSAEISTVIWDHYGILNPHTGIGRHALSLREELNQKGYPPFVLEAKYKAIKPLALSASSYNLWKSLKKIHNSKKVIVHGLSNYNIPFVRGATDVCLRCVLTVHDLIPELLPKSVSLALSTFLKFQMPRSLRRADAIISVSQWTKDQLEERYPFTRGKITVVPNGMPVINEDSLHHGWSPSPRLLTVARGEEYKRLRMIPEVLKYCPPDWAWDVVTDERGAAQLLSHSYQLSDRRLNIHRDLSDNSLQRLFSQSWAYVHPSLMEGYCLPAAQALATGRPVVFTRNSGIDEVVGNAGIGLDEKAPVTEWVEALGEVVSQHIYYRLLSRERALIAPKWSDVATRTLEVYGIL